MNAPQREALVRLIAIASSDTGQSRIVANFLLAWWNAEENGGFDPTDLWSLDDQIAADCLTVFAFVAFNRHYPDALGFEVEFNALYAQWRGNRKRKRARA